MIEDTIARPMKRDAIHIYPLHGGHVLDGADCWCMPKIDREKYADLVIHNQFAAGVKWPKREC